MKTFEEVYGWLGQLKTDREQGVFHAIPYPFPRLTEAGFYGFEQGQYNIFTAHSGVGKTHMSKFLTVINTYFFAKMYNVPIKVYYFALEESEDIFSLTIMAYLLNQLGYRFSAADLRHKLTDDVSVALNQVEGVYEDMRNYIEVIDNVSNPYGIYKHVRESIYANNTVVQDDPTKDYTKRVVFKNPNEFRFVVTDHIGLLSREMDREGKLMSQHQSMGHFSQEYCLLQMNKRLKCIVVNIQQQESSGEKKSFTNTGRLLEEKLEPYPDGLANNKEVQREAHVIMGLFSPHRHELPDYRGYPIKQFQDHIRFLSVLKDRWFGQVGKRIAIGFDGAVSKFAQFPQNDFFKDVTYREQRAKDTLNTFINNSKLIWHSDAE